MSNAKAYSSLFMPTPYIKRLSNRRRRKSLPSLIQVLPTYNNAEFHHCFNFAYVQAIIPMLHPPEYRLKTALLSHFNPESGGFLKPFKALQEAGYKNPNPYRAGLKVLIEAIKPVFVEELLRYRMQKGKLVRLASDNLESFLQEQGKDPEIKKIKLNATKFTLEKLSPDFQQKQQEQATTTIKVLNFGGQSTTISEPLQVAGAGVEEGEIIAEPSQDS